MEADGGRRLVGTAPIGELPSSLQETLMEQLPAGRWRWRTYPSWSPSPPGVTPRPAVFNQSVPPTKGAVSMHIKRT